MRTNTFALVATALFLTVCAHVANAEATHGAFLHGVASGDPTHDSVVIWTRVTPTGRDPGETDPDPHVSFHVRWRVATVPPTSTPLDPVAKPVTEGSRVPMAPGSTSFGWPDASTVAKSGIARAVADKDWTVKVDVTGLRHGVRHWYAFDVVEMTSSDDQSNNQNQASSFPALTTARRSETGTFELPPPKGTPYPHNHGPLRAAVFSCANWAWGHFHAYDAAGRGWGGVDVSSSVAGESSRLDAWFHLGDYYYEYGNTHYPNADEAVPDRWRSLSPAHETVTLDDYRRRHQLYRSDAGLQRLHASAPVIAIWDDHEIANNPWMNGAEDHQAWEGDFHVRAGAAVRAFHEWLPTREPKPNGDSSGDASGDSGFAYNRSVHFGDVASFHVLETRLTARTNPNANPSGNVWANLTAEIGKFAESSRAPAAWPGSPLETRIQAIKANLDEYRDDEGETMAGPAQLSWLADEVSASADDGVAWQVVAQASPVMDMMSPDVDAAAKSLDAEGVVKPPVGHETWRAALEAWTDWHGTGKTETFGEGGRSVPAGSARALLATGKYRVNWNFDDWHGYAAERRRLLKATVRNANRAVIIGGDSHDSWAGVIAADEAHWGVEGSYAAGGLDAKSLGKIGAVEFDTPSVSPPGAFEQSFAWCPSELIDRGHVLANPGTLRHARTGRRGFLMISVDKDEFTADFIVTPTVRSRGYTPTCDGSFVVTESPGIDGGLVFTERRCPNFPSRLFTGPADPRFVDWSSGAAAGLGAASSADDRIKQMDETWIFGVFLGAFFVVGFAAGLTWQQGACGAINARGRGDASGRRLRGNRANNYQSLEDDESRDERQSEIEMGSVGGTRPSR